MRILPHHVHFNFISLCYAYTLQVHITKVDHKARKSMFLGYKPCMIGYILLAFNTNEVFVSINAIFLKHTLLTNQTNNPHPRLIILTIWTKLNILHQTNISQYTNLTLFIAHLQLNSLQTLIHTLNPVFLLPLLHMNIPQTTQP